MSILWGPPGVGKTATIEALAKAMNLHLEVVIASIREPADFSGLPVIDQTDGSVPTVAMAPPSWATRLVEAVNQAKERLTLLPDQKPVLGVLFLDEITTAPPAVQAALLRVVLDRVVGDLQLPEEIAIVAAANPPEQAAGGWELTPPLANRFAHLEWPMPVIHDWTEALVQGWPEPKIPTIGNWQRQLPLAKGLVSAYLNKSHTGLHALPKDSAQQGKAWPSPRTWEMATRMLAAGLTTEYRQDEGMLGYLVGTCVSMGIGVEFGALVAGDSLPDPDYLLTNWEEAELPKRADKLMVALNAVSSYVISNLREGNWTKEQAETYWASAWKLMHRAGTSKGLSLDVVSIAAKSLSVMWETQYDFSGKNYVLQLFKDEIEPFHAILKQVQKSG